MRLVGPDTRRVRHGVGDVVLLDDASKQVRHRTAGVDGDVLATVGLLGEPYVNGLLELSPLLNTYTPYTNNIKIKLKGIIGKVSALDIGRTDLPQRWMIHFHAGSADNSLLSVGYNYNSSLES